MKKNATPIVIKTSDATPPMIPFRWVGVRPCPSTGRAMPVGVRRGTEGAVGAGVDWRRIVVG